MIEIKTERLVLRRLQDKDAADVTRLIGEWGVIRWLTAPPYPNTISDANWFISDDCSKGAFAITRNDTFMGIIDISDRGRDLERELGYWLGQPFQGQSYMSEAATALIADHFLRGHQGLYSGYAHGNHTSASVLTKLGFEQTGQKTAASVPLGKDIRIITMQLTLNRWQARHA